jgi:voltage-dependent potassium channel beta subunit
VYSGGQAESIMGAALKSLGWAREKFIVSTKLFRGLQDAPNLKNTLNRKYLLHAIDGSLKRMQLDFVDLLFCHRSDPETPVEETVYAMHDIISRGKALYWGTSEWPATRIMEAYTVAERYGLHKPVMEQPQYNLLHRERVEEEFAPLYESIGLGTTTWSPLASGLLTGKYNNGNTPHGSRGALPEYDWLKERLLNPASIAKVKKLEPLAKELNCSMAQLAIAWCLCKPHVSSVILGASKASQLKENLEAAKVAKALTPEILSQIEGLTAL